LFNSYASLLHNVRSEAICNQIVIRKAFFYLNRPAATNPLKFLARNECHSGKMAGKSRAQIWALNYVKVSQRKS
jgi:hypothetical protein